MGPKIWLLVELATAMAIQVITLYPQSGKDWWKTLENEAAVGAATFLLFALLFVADDLGAGTLAALFGALVIVTEILAVSGKLPVQSFLDQLGLSSAAKADKAAQQQGSGQGTKSGGSQ